jgi:hypothetical protein
MVATGFGGEKVILADSAPFRNARRGYAMFTLRWPLVIGSGENVTREKTLMASESGYLLILNKESGAVEGWCNDCDDLAGMLQPEQVAGISAFRLGAIYHHSFDLSGWRLAARPGKAESRVYLNGLTDC